MAPQPLGPEHQQMLVGAAGLVQQIGQAIDRARAAGVNVAELDQQHRALAQRVQLLQQHYGQGVG